jgi:methylenetetrahydrofolate dehydrogenase (NADP+)/methenyltetrahydrofolate cyclohydrolase
VPGLWFPAQFVSSPLVTTRPGQCASTEFSGISFVSEAARPIDGKALAAELREQVRLDAAVLRAEFGITPGLAVVLVGDDPASSLYVRNKTRLAERAGVASFVHELPSNTTEGDLLALLGRLNERDDVHAILVQLPLPPHIDAQRVMREIDPVKDVDGFHPYNVGLLGIGRPGLVPCTPLGCVRLARTVRPSLRGLEVTILGRSTVVGRPAAQLFLLEDCTVTIAHSGTRDLAALCRRADVLVVAVGRAGFVTGEAIKPGATVIDVGINRVLGEDGRPRVTGDVDAASAARVAGALTPVPGGVGPMTVAVLLENTLRCARLQLSPRGIAASIPGGTSWP